MSLLRACQHALPKTAALRSGSATTRLLSTAADTQVQTPDATDKKDVTPTPPKEVVTAEVVSGAPRELRHRAVRIFQPTRSTTQSGASKSDRWRIDWDILPGGGRWENPLMGWASSADYMQGTRLSFRSKEDAISFAERQGWDYYVAKPEINRIPPKNYSENFVYKPTTLRILRTK